MKRALLLPSNWRDCREQFILLDTQARLSNELKVFSVTIQLAIKTRVGYGSVWLVDRRLLGSGAREQRHGVILCRAGG